MAPASNDAGCSSVRWSVSRSVGAGFVAEEEGEDFEAAENALRQEIPEHGALAGCCAEQPVLHVRGQQRVGERHQAR